MGISSNFGFLAAKDERLGQAKRYARYIHLAPDEARPYGPWDQGIEQYRAPFLFARAVTTRRRAH